MSKADATVSPDLQPEQCPASQDGFDEKAFASLEEARSYLDSFFMSLCDNRLSDLEGLVSSAAELAQRCEQSDRHIRCFDYLLAKAADTVDLIKEEIDIAADALVVVLTGDPAKLSAQAIREARLAALRRGPTVAEYGAVERFKARVAELQPDEADTAAWARFQARVAGLQA